MGKFTRKIERAWNAFSQGSPDVVPDPFGLLQEAQNIGPGNSHNPGQPRRSYSNERSIIGSIYTRLSVDVAGVDIRHVRLDENGRYREDMRSGLNECLIVEANVDQGGRAFRQDIVATLFERGVAVIVPVDTSDDPTSTGSYDIHTLRVGYVVNWHPRHVRVSVYNDKKGVREEVTLPKTKVAIVENPLSSIMNEPNSTLKRLIRTLSYLDAAGEASGSGKLDMIIQLPYTIKTDARREMAEKRREDIEFQLQGSKYGIAYTDGTEKITQLNRPAENNLLKQVEYLTNLLYSQLGLTEEVMNGTADEKTMLNYHNRTVGPILDAIAEAMHRSFITKTARTQGQAIRYFRDPFKLVPINDIAEIADKFTRNEILTANEIRSVIGVKPSSDPKADELRNSNMPEPLGEESSVTAPTEEAFEDEDVEVNDALDRLGASLDSVLSDLEGELDGVT